jgi:hypothetical protein
MIIIKIRSSVHQKGRGMTQTSRELIGIANARSNVCNAMLENPFVHIPIYEVFFEDMQV